MKKLNNFLAELNETTKNLELYIFGAFFGILFLGAGWYFGTLLRFF